MLKYLRYIFTIVPRIVFDYFFFLIRYARHPEKYPLELRYRRVHNLIYYVLKKMRLDIRLKGIENFEKLEGPSLIVANHLSDMDPLILIGLSKKPLSFVAKIETYKFPVIGKAVRALEGVFMDRKDLKQSAVCLKKVGDRFKKGDLSYGIFPEGTRNKGEDATLLPFHAGSFKPASWGKVPVIPVALYGTPRILNKKPNSKRFPISVTFFEPLDSSKPSVELEETAKNLILNELQEMKAYDEAFYLEKKNKKGLRKLPKPYIHD